MEPTSIFVISDLHVGIGDKFDIFHSKSKLANLASFIDHVRAQPTSVELVVNGDLVDFLQVEPWSDYSRATALVKIKCIAEKSADVFKTLGALLHGSTHRITVLLGNHDVELAYPKVWAVLSDAILKGASPDAAPRLVLSHDRTTYRREISGVHVHIEHGNKDDPWNAINYIELFHDAETETTTFSYPPGTRLVYDTMNGVKDELQFVDVLKPEVPAAPLLLLALRPLKSIQALPDGLKAKYHSVVNGWLVKLRQKVDGPPLGSSQAVGTDPEALLADALAVGYAARLPQPLTSAKVADLEYLMYSSESEPTSNEPTLSGRLDGIKVRLIAAALWSLARFRAQQHAGDEFTAADHPDDPFAVSAKSRLVGNVKVAIFGHTHEAKKTEFDDGRVYVNSGAWANLVRLPGTTEYKELLDWMRELANNTFVRTSFLTFVRIEPSDAGATVGLHCWRDENEAKQLWKKDISR